MCKRHWYPYCFPTFTNHWSSNSNEGIRTCSIYIQKQRPERIQYEKQNLFISHGHRTRNTSKTSKKHTRQIKGNSRKLAETNDGLSTACLCGCF